MGDDAEIPPSEVLPKIEVPLDPSSVKGFNWWRRTLQYNTGLGLTPEEKLSYEKDYAYVVQNKQCKQCYENRDWLLKYSPTVIFMTQQIAKLNKIQNKEDNLKYDESKIICDACPDWKSGGFNPELGILLCQNRLRNKWHMEDTLAHELVHQFDNLKFEVDWLNLRHHACSEIRASNLSGECRIMQEFKRRGFRFDIGKGHQNCVKRRATLSVMGNPNCKDREHAEKIIDEVWDSCFNDTRPFEEIYR
ncbi:HER185Cp [Eremothecium sinecaudum]|uniref:Mitochondrial inner membrane protease ATP23 n=1 Tax=Eremothecium sinecaudum TaxID=45286 RepID=A0A0X8HTZ8_9SACH|nr:HER185Cp [Eremothecium sinecaudum]AMD21464.1 HER185Cp [Eremothecium sinecaudum]